VSAPSKDRLGRGLGALLGEYLPESSSEAQVRDIPVTAIVPNPLQPRREFNPAELESLAASIAENGLLQPLLVRPAAGRTDRYELVAGERRLRAVTALEWTEVKAIVREIEDEALLVMALVENLQREELTPLEEAEGYRSLVDRFGLTQDEIAKAVGKDRSTVANMLRLLRLPPSIRKLLDESRLSMGHARALLGVADPSRAADLARKAVAGDWSVREVERRVRAVGSAARTPAAPAGNGRQSETDFVHRALTEALQEALGTRARFQLKSDGSGTIEVPFRDDEDLQRVFLRMTGRELSDVLS
jgi:ParB family chromosome partitioning protein